MARRASDIAQLTGVSFWRGFLGFSNSDNLTYAASIAYYGLLSLFPVLLLGFALLGSATEDLAARTAVLSFVLQYFPSQFDFITRQLDEFRTHSVSLGIGGTLALIWGALGVFGAVTTAVNYAWGVDKQRSFWTHELYSFLMLVIAELLFLAALLLVSASEVAGASWFAGVIIR